jgi:anti-sigma28 factor (negative regulator of flagellin synthesis)
MQEMPDHSRVWVYQTNRALSKEEAGAIQEAGVSFVSNWQAHQKDLQASFEVLKDRFVLIAVDEEKQEATGCSIDRSVHFLQGLEKQLGIKLFDRTQVVYMVEGELREARLAEIKEKIAKGEIQKDTLTFNNLVQSKKEWKEKWMIPAQESWLSRYFMSKT